MGWGRRDFDTGVSLSANERNFLFANLKGVQFADVSGISGADSEADARAVAWLDYDRDGWLDLVATNANRPLLQLFHNELGRQLPARSVIALRFIGGNQGSNPKPGWSARDGYGALVDVSVGDVVIRREHRAGEGLAAQNSATLVVGIGEHERADAVKIRWPSGRRQTLSDVPAGTLLTVYEDPGASPDGSAFLSAAYRAAASTTHVRPRPTIREPTPVEVALTKSIAAQREPAKLRVFATMATWCGPCVEELPTLAHLRTQFDSDEMDLIGIPVDIDEGRDKLDEFVQRYSPAYELLHGIDEHQIEALRVTLERRLGSYGIPASIITDSDGAILDVLWGAPTLSDLRRLLREAVN